VGSSSSRLEASLASRWIIAVAAALAFALTLPSLGNGLAIDDHLYRARVAGDHWDAAHAMSDLFMFADARHPEIAREEMSRGELSWWAAPHLHWRYFRPLAQATHYAEFRIFPHGGTGWMHLHSVAWYALLAALVALLYRRMFGATWVAGLAAILYAIDDGHGFTVGWLANRCGLMGAVFAVITLYLHDRWRRDNWRAGAILGPLALATTLFASEEGIAVCGVLGAYMLVLDRGTWRARIATMAPYVGVVLGWYALWHALGYGIDGTGSYLDPVRYPGRYILNVLQRVPILIHSELGALPADLWEVYFVRHALTWVMVLAGSAFIAILVVAFARLVRTDRLARFWAVGFVLSLLLVCGAHPTDRHLLVVGVCGSALVARFLQAWLERAKPEQRALLPRGATILAGFFVLVHLVAAPVLMPVRVRLPGAVSRGVAKIDSLVPSDPALATQDLVLVNVPFKYLCNFASVVRRSDGGISPRAWRCLGVSADDVAVERPDLRTLVLRPAYGYLRYFEDTNVRSRLVPFAAGDRVELPGITITVREITPDERPAVVEFQFAVPLEYASLRWLVWQDGRYQPYTPPAVGSHTTLPAQHFAFGDLLEDR
jgi:hypothetical protein